MHCINITKKRKFAMKAFLKSRVRENRKHGSVGGIIDDNQYIKSNIRGKL